GDRTVERRRHEQFAADRFDGTEWFRRSPALEAHVAGLAAGVDDPWLRYARWVSEAVARSG
ncbi:MAG: GIY-YIG nuclease family protein, partial [Microbacterium sp.]